MMGIQIIVNLIVDYHRIETIKKNALPFEYIWMDAGWYGIDTKPTPDEFEGDWGCHTGDWRVSPLVHPQGLKDVSKAVHDAGMKLLLWFEPERVIRTTPTAVAHPEYFLSSNNPNDNNRLLNLGNKEAWEYCFETLSRLIEELNIDCYRQDLTFNLWLVGSKTTTPTERELPKLSTLTGCIAFGTNCLKNSRI